MRVHIRPTRIAAVAVLALSTTLAGCQTGSMGSKKGFGTVGGAVAGGLIGQRINLNNSQSGNQGTIVPVRDGYDGSGSYCREFQQTIVVGGRTEQAFGTACRQPDGSWKIMG